MKTERPSSEGVGERVGKNVEGLEEEKSKNPGANDGTRGTCAHQNPSKKFESIADFDQRGEFLGRGGERGGASRICSASSEFERLLLHACAMMGGLSATRKEETMGTTVATVAVQKSNAVLAIFVGGLIAGALDLTSAFITYGPGVPRAIAGGLLGRAAMQGGLGTYVLGILLHFFIACSAAAIYYAVSRKLGFMTEHAVVCGLFYGIAVFLVMNLIVLPLSALHAKGPYHLGSLVQGLLVHMILIGLPIALSVRRFSK